jgi:hypothetical protein
MKLLANMEHRLESKCDSLRLYLLDQLDTFLPLEIEGVPTVETDAAKHNATLAARASPDVPDISREIVPITHIRATQGFDCGLPISKRSCGLDQEGWLFVSHPKVEEGSTDPSVA